MNVKYVVNPGGSVMHPNGVDILKAGTVLDQTVFSQKVLDEHVRSRYARAMNMGGTPADDPNALVEAMPGVNTDPKAINQINNDDDRKNILTGDPGKPSVINTGLAGGIQTNVSSPPDQPIKQIQSKWVIDPSALAGKSLQELNVMILERDPSFKPPMASVEEAIGWLSQDFSQVAQVAAASAAAAVH